VQTLARTLYSAALWLAQPLLRAKLAQRAEAEPAYAQHVQERFGYYDFPADHGAVWIHAVSLGETRAAAILIAQLRQRIPNMRLLLTHGTATGRAEGAKLLQEGDRQVWLPWDTTAAVRQFFVHFQPRIGIVMETEVWPNLCAAAQAIGVPLVLANARLNEKSARSAQRLAWLAQPAYAAFSQVWAQTSQDAQRLVAVGAQHVSVQGNLKFDAQLSALQLAQGKAWRAASGQPVVLLASSREGEEDLFLQKIKKLSQSSIEHAAIDNAAINILKIRKVQWLIVARHPQRFDEVANKITLAGFTVSRRSQWADAPLAADVWLGDSLGEMALYYGLADVALLGGSFAPLGGQNLIEAIAAGCPVVMGPHTFNFADASNTAVDQHAALRAIDMASGLEAAVLLSMNTQRRTAMQSAGDHWLKASRGTAQRMVDAVLSLI
jgi:3-deoxy-D-manno-octulosonic-acid transferase